MTREEALEIFEHNWTCLKNHAYTDNELDEALEVAIKVLEQEQEPKTDMWSIKEVADALEKHGFGMLERESQMKSCEDCISRQAVDEIKELMTDISGDTVYAVRMSDIRQLPPVTPKQKTDILDKIRAEIAEIHLIGYATVDGKREIASRAVMQIIDKYRQEE